MSGVGIGELVWLVIAVLLGLGVVIAWIIRSETSRNLSKIEIQRLKARISDLEHEKFMIIEEMNASGGVSATAAGSPDSDAGSKVIAKMAARVEELEKENARLKKELNEARSSLEEVYKALVQ